MAGDPLSHAAHLAFGPLVLMWELMMIAMMAPTAARWIAVFSTLSAAPGNPVSRVRSACAFAGGYVTVWLPYSVAAAGLQVALQRGHWLAANGALARPLAGIVLIGAGGFQFAALKRTCLAHCRNPLTYFLARWQNGPPGGFRVGLEHGAFCVGCCWALMATVFAVGLMNVVWMAALTLIGCLEQIMPHGDKVSAVAGVGLMAWGAALLIHAAG